MATRNKNKPQELPVVVQLKAGEAGAHLRDASGVTVAVSFVPPFPSPLHLRKLPPALQEAILAASAELAEAEYRTNKELTDFEAFAEEERYVHGGYDEEGGEAADAG